MERLVMLEGVLRGSGQGCTPLFRVSRGNKGVTGEWLVSRGNKGLNGFSAAGEGVGRSELAQEPRPLSIAQRA